MSARPTSNGFAPPEQPQQTLLSERVARTAALAAQIKADLTQVVDQTKKNAARVRELPGLISQIGSEAVVREHEHPVLGGLIFGRETLVEDEAKLEAGRATLDKGQQQLAEDRAELDAGNARLAQDRETLSDDEAKLAAGRATLVRNRWAAIKRMIDVAAALGEAIDTKQAKEAVRLEKYELDVLDRESAALAREGDALARESDAIAHERDTLAKDKVAFAISAQKREAADLAAEQKAARDSHAAGVDRLEAHRLALSAYTKQEGDRLRALSDSVYAEAQRWSEASLQDVTDWQAKMEGWLAEEVVKMNGWARLQRQQETGRITAPDLDVAQLDAPISPRPILLRPISRAKFWTSLMFSPPPLRSMILIPIPIRDDADLDAEWAQLEADRLYFNAWREKEGNNLTTWVDSVYTEAQRWSKYALEDSAYWKARIEGWLAKEVVKMNAWARLQRQQETGQTAPELVAPELVAPELDASKLDALRLDASDAFRKKDQEERRNIESHERVLEQMRVTGIPDAFRKKDEEQRRNLEQYENLLKQAQDKVRRKNSKLDEAEEPEEDISSAAIGHIGVWR